MSASVLFCLNFPQGNRLLIDDTSYLTGLQDLDIVDTGPASHGLIHFQGSLSSSNRFWHCHTLFTFAFVKFWCSNSRPSTAVEGAAACVSIDFNCVQAFFCVRSSPHMQLRRRTASPTDVKHTCNCIATISFVSQSLSLACHSSDLRLI